MGPPSLRSNDGFHVSIWVELNHRFRQIEIDRSTTTSFRIQLQGQFIHSFELWYQLGKLLSRFVIPVEYTLNLRVSHAFGAADNAFTNLISKDLAACIYFHDAAHHQTLFVGPQAAHTARKLRR